MGALQAPGHEDLAGETSAADRFPPNFECARGVGVEAGIAAGSHVPEAVVCSEQVHIQLGGVGEMVVNYVTKNAQTAKVYFGDTAAELDRWATGSSSSYSQLMSYTSLLYDAVLELQNTSGWAFDPVTGEKYGNYQRRQEVKTGLGRYNNPQVIAAGW